MTFFVNISSLSIVCSSDIFSLTFIRSRIFFISVETLAEYDRGLRSACVGASRTEFSRFKRFALFRRDTADRAACAESLAAWDGLTYNAGLARDRFLCVCRMCKFVQFFFARRTRALFRSKIENLQLLKRLVSKKMLMLFRKISDHLYTIEVHE